MPAYSMLSVMSLCRDGPSHAPFFWNILGTVMPARSRQTLQVPPPDPFHSSLSACPMEPPNLSEETLSLLLAFQRGQETTSAQCDRQTDIQVLKSSLELTCPQKAGALLRRQEVKPWLSGPFCLFTCGHVQSTALSLDTPSCSMTSAVSFTSSTSGAHQLWWDLAPVLQ